MPAVFDGHNDALTCDDHDSLVRGRAGGHLDLPRMRAGGIRGGIFSVFVASPEDHSHDGPQEPVEHELAAARAGAVAGRLLALERAGEGVCGARCPGSGAAVAGGGLLAAVLHLEGAEAIDPGSRRWRCGTRRGCARWASSGAGPTPSATACRSSPRSPDTGPGLTEAGRALVRACIDLGIMVDVSHLNEAGFWDVARARLGPLVATHSGVHALSPPRAT